MRQHIARSKSTPALRPLQTQIKHQVKSTARSPLLYGNGNGVPRVIAAAASAERELRRARAARCARASASSAASSSSAAADALDARAARGTAAALDLRRGAAAGSVVDSRGDCGAVDAAMNLVTGVSPSDGDSAATDGGRTPPPPPPPPTPWMPPRLAAALGVTPPPSRLTAAL